MKTKGEIYTIGGLCKDFSILKITLGKTESKSAKLTKDSYSMLSDSLYNLSINF